MAQGVSKPLHVFNQQGSMNPSKIVKQLYPPEDTEQIHPSIHDLGIKLLADKFQSSNQMTVAILLAIKEVIKDFKQTKKMIYHQELLQLIRDKIVPYLEKCRRFFSGTDYAMQYIRTQITKIAPRSSGLSEMKEELFKILDEFINERIIFAQDALVKNALTLFSDKEEEVFLVYGNKESHTLELIFKEACQMKKKFRVIVVDSAPDYLGRSMVKRVASLGIKC